MPTPDIQTTHTNNILNNSKAIPQHSLLMSAASLGQRDHMEDTHRQISSGFERLDRALQGGWPTAGVIELNCKRLGTGELRLLLPTLSQLNEDNTLQAWVNPPAHLNAQALAQAGINLERTIVVQNHPAKNTYWAIDQLLRSGCCSAIIFWCQHMTTAQAKRLQIQAKQHGTLVFAIKLKHQSEHSLPISLRMELKPCAHGIWVNIFKRQNGWPIKPFELSMTTEWPWLSPKNNPLKQLNHQLALGLKSQPNPRTSRILPFPKKAEATKPSSLAQ